MVGTCVNRGAQFCWRTSATPTLSGHLAPVPPAEAPTSIGEQLAAALQETGVSARELARRLAAADGSLSESKRRWIQKVLADELEAPSMDAVAKALKKPRGYFQAPPRESRRRLGRLEELEGEVARLREEHASFVRVATERMAALEADLANATRRSGQRSTQKGR